MGRERLFSPERHWKDYMGRALYLLGLLMKLWAVLSRWNRRLPTRL